MDCQHVLLSTRQYLRRHGSWSGRAGCLWNSDAAQLWQHRRHGTSRSPKYRAWFLAIKGQDSRHGMAMPVRRRGYSKNAPRWPTGASLLRRQLGSRPHGPVAALRSSTDVAGRVCLDSVASRDGTPSYSARRCSHTEAKVHLQGGIAAGLPLLLRTQDSC